MQEEEKKKETTAEKIKRYVLAYKKMSVKKKTQVIAIILIIAVILTIYFSSITDKTKPDAQTTDDTGTEQTASVAEDTETKLERALSDIDGVGRVQVMITYVSGPEIVPVFTTDTQKGSTEDTDGEANRMTKSENEQTDIVTVKKGGDENALVLKENTPDVKGVIVIAEGAGDLKVKMDLLRAVQTILAVPPGQVEIFEMKKG